MKERGNSRGFIQIIIIILAVLVLVGGAYYFGTLKNKTTSVIPTLTPVVSALPSSSPIATADPTANWKTFSQDKFSFRLPTTWTSSQYSDSYGSGWIFKSGAPGREEFIVSKPNLNLDKLKSDVLSNLWSNLPSATKTVVLGDTTGIEYYGCFGEDGCMNQYIVVTGFNGLAYKIEFTPYPDQGANLYKNIISSFKFTK